MHILYCFRETHYCFMQPIVDKPKKKRAVAEQLEGSDGEMDPDDLEAMVIEAEQMDGEKPVTDEKPQCFVFFDIEVQQNTKLTTDVRGSVFLHVPNAVVAQKCCEFCQVSNILVVCNILILQSILYYITWYCFLAKPNKIQIHFRIWISRWPAYTVVRIDQRSGMVRNAKMTSVPGCSVVTMRAA